MSAYNLSYNVLVNGVVTIDWPAEVKEEILIDLLWFRQRILHASINGVREVVNGFHSLWVYTDKNVAGASITAELKTLYEEQSSSPFMAKTWTIPVCYDALFAKDMEQLKNVSDLSELDIIKVHSSTLYRIYMIGFLPGFLYLGGLDPRLHIPRKANPDPKIDSGSVAIGGSQTGIYPYDSPGGWHVIGKTPINIFDKENPPYCPTAPGDHVQFEPISLDEFRRIKKLVANKKFELTHA